MILQGDGLHPERRMTPRVVFETSAMVSMVNQRFKCLTRNLSPQGLALAGHRGSAPPGTFMRIEFELPMETRPVGVDGVLVRSNPHSSGMIWGLRFIETQPETQRKIERYLETRVPESSRFSQRIAQEAPAAVVLPRQATPVRPPERVPPVTPVKARTPVVTSAVVPHAQVVELYEDAMLKASQKRFVAKAGAREQAKTVKPSARWQSKGHTTQGSTTDLETELRWLYEQAAKKKSN
jgi:hypothetical protein